MYKLVNSEKNEMNEKQVKLKEFMIAFEKKSPLILISATAVKCSELGPTTRPGGQMSRTRGGSVPYLTRSLEPV